MFSFSFLITSLIVVLIPGTGVIYTISTALTGSRKDGIIATIGCTLGIVPHLVAGILGVSALLHFSAEIFQVIKVAGTFYLIYLGYNLIKSKNIIEFDNKKKKKRYIGIIIKGILINLLNPKLTIFFFSFLPQFLVNSKTSYSSQMIALGLVFMVLTLIVFILYGLLANYFKKIIIGSKKLTYRIQQGFGIILIGFAARLALSEN
jgi:threonine/homoserine/homoserine lactone efflux protein